MNNYNVMVRGIVVNGDMDGRRARSSGRCGSIRGASATIPSRTSSSPCRARRSTRFRRQGLEYLGAALRVHQQQPGAGARPLLSWRCSSRWASRRARRSSRMRGRRAHPRRGRTDRRRDGSRRCSSTASSASRCQCHSPARTGTGCMLVNPTQETEHYSQVDERLHYTYGAIYTSPGIGVKKAGPGSQYIQAFKDKDGNRLDGGKSYRLHVPAERAGGGVLVGDALRHRDPLDDPEPEQRLGPLVATTSSRSTPTARLTCTSRPRPRRPRMRATGSRRFPARASIR